MLCRLAAQGPDSGIKHIQTNLRFKLPRHRIDPDFVSENPGSQLGRYVITMSNCITLDLVYRIGKFDDFIM